MTPFRWLFRPARAYPILLRLDLGGAPCPASVDVETEWLPARKTARTKLLSASSMVLLPWHGDAEEARVSIRIGGRVGRTTVTREANRDGTVVELALRAV